MTVTLTGTCADNPDRMAASNTMNSERQHQQILQYLFISCKGNKKKQPSVTFTSRVCQLPLLFSSLFPNRGGFVPFIDDYPFNYQEVNSVLDFYVKTAGNS